MSAPRVDARHEPATRVAPRVLVVDDEAVFANAAAKHLRHAGFASEVAGTLARAREAIAAERPELILLDMRLPDGTGIDLLKHLQETDAADVPVVVLTAFGHVDDAVHAMKLKAVDYLKKPIDLDELAFTLRKVLGTAEVTRQLDYSRQRETHARENYSLLGDSDALQDIRRQLQRIGQLSGVDDAPVVLIVGETGTGKDLAARYLHQQSARHDRPFVHVDCATLPRELIESELFGHEKGAFTGAATARTGLIEAAENGTLFLDEIAELPLELQPKLLAVLERRKVRRVGSSRERTVGAWLIAATNRPLEQLVEDGLFRSDLYYRLQVMTIHMPPLRTRGGDIEQLANYFTAVTARRFGLHTPQLDASAIEVLNHYAWPGNVRELAHFIERAVLLSGGETLTGEALSLSPAAQQSATPTPEAFEGLTLQAVEKLLIERALARCRGNVSQAARELGITRMALRYRIKQHAIDPGDLPASS